MAIKNDDIDSLVSSSFHTDLDIAWLSLKRSLWSYFSTYRSMEYSLSHFDDPKIKLEPAKQRSIHQSDYIENYVETIVHLQHFAELVLKQFLREVHPVLADKSSNKTLILYKLLKGEPLSDGEEENSIEFSLTIKRIKDLINQNKLRSELSYLTAYTYFLEKLNSLRNGIWHRGLRVLPYDKLDRLISKCAFPFIKETIELSEHKKFLSYWKYNSLACTLDPIFEIIAEGAKPSMNFGKIALLKEMGRAAYENPLSENKEFGAVFNKSQIHHAEEIAFNRMMNSSKQTATASDVDKCPVCGLNSLMIFDDYEVQNEGQPDQDVYRYSYKVQCSNCTFTVNDNIKNPKEYGYSDIKDFWQDRSV